MKKIRSKFRKSIAYLTRGGLKQLFGRIDQLRIKKGVDELGLEKFIHHCALMAAGSGVITGAGGMATMAIGVPLDLINLITQQFRVTMAISYYNTGSYKLQYDDFIKIIAASLHVDAGMAVTKNVMEQIGEKLILNIGTKTAERIVPIVGAVIGGTVNYLFIKRVANSLLNTGTATA